MVMLMVALAMFVEVYAEWLLAMLMAISTATSAAIFMAMLV